MARGGIITLYVGNLPEKLHWCGLRQAFRRHGDLVDAYIAKKLDRQGKLFGFVRYSKMRDARRAMESFNGFKIFGFRLVVFLTRYNARTSYWKKQKVVPQSLNQRRAEGIEEKNVAIESHKLEEAGKVAVNGNNGGCKKISGFVDNETLWMLGKCLVGTMAKDYSTKEPGDNVVASQNPIQERISDDILAMGSVRDEAQIEEEVGDFEVGDGELYGSEGKGVANISPGQKEKEIPNSRAAIRRGHKTPNLATLKEKALASSYQNFLMDLGDEVEAIEELVSITEMELQKSFDGVVTIGRCFVVASLAWLVSNVHLVWLSFGWSLDYVGVFLCNLDYMYASNWKSMVLKLQAQEELLACFVLEAYVDFGYGQIWRLIAYCGVARSRKELEVRCGLV
ncbi:hypothetical protein V6N12_057042 [Hibiscus sabdariffa]|uniref:RRM domain-containing protein n=1 Tax=Hibiscus sabdariffa TaxID=183260 RepID=A0ABR2DD63_9ROSI